MIVVDVNVVAYFFIEGEKTGLAHELRRCDPDWVLPSLWRHEFLNVLATFARAGGASIVDVQTLYLQSVDMLGNAERDVDMTDALALATRLGVSTNDAQYATLAQQLGTACVSEDKRLQRTFPDIVHGMQGFIERRSHER